MSKEKFTPGPWTLCNGRIIQNYGEELTILSHALEYGPDTPVEESVANAHLIAAAPEMFEALEQVLKSAKMNDETLDVVYAALYRARGEL